MTCVPFAANTSSNAPVNLLSRSRIKNLNYPVPSPRPMSKLRACWAVQAPSGCAVTPSMCTARVWISKTNNTYTRWSSTVSTCKKSHARMPDAWAARSCRQAGAARRGAGPSPAAARIRRMVPSPIRYPSPAHLALDTPIPPARVLPRQQLHQRAHLVRDRRSARRVRMGPFHPDQAPVPGQQGARGHDPMQPQVQGSSLAKAASTARSAQSGSGRETCRRKTAISCRSTKISTSLTASLRARSTSQPNIRTINK